MRCVRTQKQIDSLATQEKIWAEQNKAECDAESMDGDAESALRDAGLGTDEDYGGGIERL